MADTTLFDRLSLVVARALAVKTAQDYLRSAIEDAKEYGDATDDDIRRALELAHGVGGR